VVIEHSQEVIKCADQVSDFEKRTGEDCGHVVFEGIPEEFVRVEGAFTGKYFGKKLIIDN
jgi:excinuclease ABC subunit A